MLPLLALYWADHSIRFACSPLYLNVWQSDPFSTQIFSIISFKRSCGTNNCSFVPTKGNASSSSAHLISIICYESSTVSLVLVESPLVCQFNEHFICRRYHIFITWQYSPHLPVNITTIQHRDGYCNEKMEKLLSHVYGLARACMRFGNSFCSNLFYCLRSIFILFSRNENFQLFIHV